MLAPRTAGAALAGLVLLLTLAGIASAHPIANDDVIATAGVGNPGNAAEAPAVSGPHPVAVERAPFPRAMASEGRFLLPSGSLPESAVDPATRRAAPVSPIDATPASAGLEESDPLASGLRSPLGASSLAGMPPSAQRPSTFHDQGASQTAGEIALSVNELRASVVEAIAEATDARKDREGRISFSVAGIEGLHFASQGGTLTVGYGDTSLTIVEQGSSPRAQQAAPAAARAASSMPGPQDSNSSHDLVELGKEVLQYPLFWVVILFLAIGKIALHIAKRRSLSRRRRHGGSRPSSSQQVKMKRQRKRHRVRFRLKRAPSSVGLQER